MNFDAFRDIVEEVKTKKPILFGLGHDTIPSMKEIADFQNRHQIQLPEKYIQFINNYGGGYFGYTNIYSLDEKSDFYLLRNNQNISAGFLFVSDNGCGDFYGFRIENRKCDDGIYFYNHDDNSASETSFSDILEYLIKIGLKM